MRITLLSIAGLLLTASAAYAQDSLRNTTPSIGKEQHSINNIRYVDLHVNRRGWSYRIPEFPKEKELKPSYLDACPATWSGGWFIGASAGGSVFAGEPIGCEDLSGRIKPAVQLTIGKWLVPSFGLRLHYLGHELVNGDIESQNYHSLNADMMIDIASIGSKGIPKQRVSLIPFAGYGITWNTDVNAHPLSLHYGIIGTVRISRHLDLNLELSGTSTFSDFDGIGSGSSFGDRIFCASLGLSYAIGCGHAGQRIIDAGPYMEQNHRLMDQNNELETVTSRLLSELSEKDRAIAEYRKILKIKGWLSSLPDTLTQMQTDEAECITLGYPYNSYNGLNYLLERLHDQSDMAEKGDNIRDSEKLRTAEKPLENVAQGSNGTEGESPVASPTDYRRLIDEGKACLGAPILFFFAMNSTRLTDPLQEANLKEMATIASRYNLRITITGAADRATGGTEKNRRLSIERSDYISSELQRLGVRKEQIQCCSQGGIDAYTPTAANRHTRVELFLQ